MNEDQEERQRYARKPTPARPKGATAEPAGIRTIEEQGSGRMNIVETARAIEAERIRLVEEAGQSKFEFHQAAEEPRQQADINATVDEAGAFHIFSLIIKSLRKVDKTTRRRIIGLINELEMDK